MPNIKLDHITMKFGDLTAVRDISLDIQSGEYVAILGPSGCGKTTLIKVIAGIWHPTEGKVYIDGDDVTDVPIEDRDVGYAFQNIALFPHMNLRKNVGYGQRVRDVPEHESAEVTEKYISLVKMLDRAGYLPSELSGGEQQKIAIARALASGSKMLMLDEPLSALDAKVRMELRYEIKRIVKDLGITVLHVTHDQEEAMSVSDRIVLMRKGTIAEIGAPMDIYRNPKSIFTAFFIGETNLIICTVSQKSKMGKTTVRLRNGLEVRASKSGFNVGDPVVISVRPESVYTADDGLLSTVISVNFMGTFWRIRTVSESEDFIEYNEPADVEVLPKIGEKVYLVFNKKMTKVFARPENGLEEEIRLD